MKKKYLIIIAILLIVALGATLVNRHVLNPEHRDITQEETTASLNASEIHKQFSTNEAASLKLYLDKVLEISGTITDLETNAIVLEDKIQVGLINNNVSSNQIGNNITIKGRCVGYDELLEMVKIDQATLTTNNN